MLRHALYPVPWQGLIAEHPNSLIVRLCAYLASMGWIGVDLFFVLSGFLIGSQLFGFFSTRKPLNDLWLFLAHRALRILPAYYGLLLLIQFGLPRIPVFQQAVYFQHIPGQMLWHWLLMQDYTGAYIYPVLWSLGVEEKFYLLAPILIGGVHLAGRMTDRWRLPLILTILFSLLLLPAVCRFFSCVQYPVESVAMYRHFRFSMLHLRCDGLIAGIIVAYVVRYMKQTIPWMGERKLPWALLLMGLFIVWQTTLWLPGELNASFPVIAMAAGGLLISLGFGAMVFGATMLPNKQTGFLGLHVFYVTATLSYSLYLLHDLLVAPISQAWFSFSFGQRWSFSIQLIGYLACFTLTAFIVALASYYIVEKPFLMLKERLTFCSPKPTRKLGA